LSEKNIIREQKRAISPAKNYRVNFKVKKSNNVLYVPTLKRNIYCKRKWGTNTYKVYSSNVGYLQSVNN
jgi:hypothetical protein